MHVLTQNANVSAHVLKKSVSIKRIKEKKYTEIEMKFFWLVGFTLNKVLKCFEQSRLNSMHEVGGANHTTLLGNLRKTTRNICLYVELTASEAVRVRRIVMFLPHSDPL